MGETHHSLEGKTALVTGGGGILGRGFCRMLAGHGARVAVVDVSAKAAQEAVKAIHEELPAARLAALECDVADAASVTSMVDAATRQLGPIDILCNNAATKTNDLDAFFAPFEEYTLQTWRDVMAVNLDGMFLVAQAVGKRMVERQRGGSIVQTASIYGVVGPDQRVYEGSFYMNRQISSPAVYSASKAGVIGLTKYLAAYWGAHGIRVNTLTPGGVESGQNGTFQQRYSARVPLARMALRNEIEAALLFLASDESSYITGQNLIVDGGLTCW